MRLRHPIPTDAEAVLAVLVARDIADIGAPDVTRKDLEDQWNGSDFDLTVDARVVEAADGRVVGYAAMSREVTITAVVAPDHEGQGVGSRLRHWAEQRDRARGRGSHRQWIAAGNEAARALLVAAGYQPGRSYWRLSRALDDIPGPGGTGPDLTLRSVDVEIDASVLHALNELSFKANPDYEPFSLPTFRETHLDAHDFDPELSCVAESDGQPVAFLLARRWRHRNVGFIDVLGVHPDHRSRGLGTTMLQTAFRRFAAAGLQEAQLGVASDNRAALSLYERCGMTGRFRYDTYERPADSNPRIRLARTSEASKLETLQRRSSDIWAEYRDQLAAHPDAIELPQTFIDRGWVRVAVTDEDVPVGFSVLIPTDSTTYELDGLFVEPDHLRRGIGLALIRDAVTRAAASGGRRIEVTAGPAQGFYERTGFHVIGRTQTRFGAAVRMRRTIVPADAVS